MPPLLPKRKHTSTPRQTKLSFTPSSSSPAPATGRKPPRASNDDEDDSDSDRPRVRFGKNQLPGSGFFGVSASSKRARSISDDNESDEEEKLKQKIRDKKKRQSRIAREASRSTHTPPVVIEEDEEDEDLLSLDQITRGADKRGSTATKIPPRKRAKVVTIEEDDEDSDLAGDIDIGSQVRPRQISRILRDEDTPKKQKPASNRKKAVVVDSDDENEQDEEDEDDLPPMTPVRRKRILEKNQKRVESDDEDDEDEIPTKRLRHSSLNPKSTADDRDSDDIASDAELAASTPIMPSRTRTGQPKKLTPFQKKLALLKAKRNGDYQSGDEVEEEDDSPQRALYDSSSGEGNDYDEEGGLEDEEEEDDEKAVSSSPPLSGKPPRRRPSDYAYPDSDNDSDIADFIVSDASAPPSPGGTAGKASGKHSHIGQYDPSHIPIQFTSHSHASSKTHFKTAAFFLIQQILLYPNAANSPKQFQNTLADQDEYTQYAFHFLDRKINSFRDSVLSSSAWAPTFLLALKNRPGFSYDEGTGSEMEHCSACNRRDKHATFAIMFTGNVYDHTTLIDIPPPKRKKGSRGSPEEKDNLGNVIPSSTTRFPVGRFCFERAEITHSFWHWKKGLRVALEEMLGRMGAFKQDNKTKTSKKSQKKNRGGGSDEDDDDDGGESEDDDNAKKESQEEREERAVEVMKKLDQDGDIDLMYDMFEAQIKRAEERY
ncbi:hypothetical protein DFH27DRAFT_530583 [Peziza echinospora]|nr:hypothetical protein DFH27DRAFT_530583 [Peziza echinospora]